MIERDIVQTLCKRCKEERHFIQILKGPRQSGKTTALKQLKEKLKMPVHVGSASIDLCSRDWLRAQWTSARNLAAANKTNTASKVGKTGKRNGASGANDGALLIIDEVQLINQWSAAVKELWDEDTWNDVNLKVVLSGSSSLLLEEGLKEGLTGRFEVVPCTHWSFAECKKAFDYSLDDFLFFGGYPASSLLKDNRDRWLEYMQNSIIAPSITRDVVSLEQVRKPALMEKLFWIGSSFSSQEISYRKILGQLDDAGNTTTIAHYLQLLDNASLLCGLQKFSNKVIKSRASSPKFLTYDTSLMVTTYGEHRDFLLTDPALRGRLIESAVGAFLLTESKRQNFKIFWWREGNDEVDFVLQKGQHITAIEVKSGRVKPTGGMTRFVNTFNPTKQLIVGSADCPIEAFLLGKVELF